MVSLFKMKKKAEFPFGQARRISPSKVIAAPQAIQEQFSINYTRRRRPVNSEALRRHRFSVVIENGVRSHIFYHE